MVEEQEYEEDEVLPQSQGMTPPEAIEKLFQLPITEKDLRDGMSGIWKKMGWDNTPFSVIRPTRDFILGRNDPFDEYEITGDYEDGILLSMLHKAFYGYALVLFQFALARAALTRSRGGFQQINLRTYYAQTLKGDMTPGKGKSWIVPPAAGSKR